MYIDKLGDIFNKCNKTYHGTIKMNPAYVKPSMYIDFDQEKTTMKVLNLKFVIMLRLQNII